MHSNKSHLHGMVTTRTLADLAGLNPGNAAAAQPGALPDSSRGTATLSAASGTVTNGGTELFTLYDPKNAGKVFDYAFTGPGTDQVGGSLTGSVKIGADGIAYIDVSIVNDGQNDPDQSLTLEVDGLSSTVTVHDTGSSSAQTTYTLGSSVETLTLATPNNLVLGELGTVNAFGEESGGTLIAGDVIDGGASNTTTLSLSQNDVYPNYPFDVLPEGISITNVQELIVNSNQALGGTITYNGNTGTEYFNTTGIDTSGPGAASTLGSLYVHTSFGEDYIEAGSATDVTVNNDGPLSFFSPAGVTLVGGDNVNVLETGGPAALPSSANISYAAGTVSVTDANASAGGSINIYGGTDIFVNGYGTVAIGGETGNVTVNDFGAGDAISVSGGHDQSITGTGAITLSGSTGLISVTDAGDGAAVEVTGESSRGGTVTGAGSIAFSAVASAATLTVNQDSAGFGDGNVYGIRTGGGENLVINNVGGYIEQSGAFVANGNTIREGAAPDIVTNPDGTQSDVTAYTDAGASVTINDSLTAGSRTYDSVGQVTAYTNGATVATITGGSDLLLEDVNTIELVRSPGAQATPGTSKLASVTLDGVGGSAEVVTDALTTLTLDNSGANETGVTDVTVFDRSTAALSLNLADDAYDTILTDNSASAISVTVTGSYDDLFLAAAAASSLTISGSQVLYLESGAGLGKLASITITGGAGLYDGGTATGLGTYGSLTAINGSGTSGDINVAIGPHQTFTGGSGIDTVTISADQLAKVYGGTGSSNVLVANGSGSIFTAAHTGKLVSGFQILRTTGLSGGTYDLKNVFGGITDVDVAAAPSAALTFSNAGATQTLSIDTSLASAGEVTLVENPALTAPTSLSLFLGTADTAGIAAQSVSATGYKSVSIASQGLVNPETGLSEGVNTVSLADLAITSVSITGAESLVVGSNGSSVGTITATSLASATLDLLGLGITSGGVTLNDGASTVLFTGKATSVKTDTVNFTTANDGENVITESGNGALVVNGASADGANTIFAKGVLDVTLGSGNNTIYGGAATTSIEAGSGNNTIAVGSATGTLGVTIGLGDGSNTVSVLGLGADTISVGGGKSTTESITVGNGQGTILVGTATTTGSLAGRGVITVGNGTDKITAGAGTYTVTLGTGSDTLSANLGATDPGGVTVTIGDTAANHFDTISLGNGTNTIYGADDNGNNVISVGSGSNTVTIGAGANTITLNGGTNTINLAAAGSASVFTTITGAAAGTTIAFLTTNGAAEWVDGSAGAAQVELPSNATFADYLNAATFADGATNSQLAWFDFSGSQYLVEDNSSAGTFVSGTDYVVKFSGTSLNFPAAVIDAAHDGVTFHS